VLEREFNFKIKGLMTDFKGRSNADPDALVMVTEEDVIYYTKKGNIITFLPYKNSTEDELLSYDFCEHRHFLTLHSHLFKG
jgi:hypothetical protein